jgi:hypothetical protein
MLVMVELEVAAVPLRAIACRPADRHPAAQNLRPETRRIDALVALDPCVPSNSRAP